MRIRKRTPARAASPGPSPALTPSPPHPPRQLPKEMLASHEVDDDEAEEKRVILVAGAGGREDGRVPDASEISSLNDDVPKPEPEPEPQDGGGGARCNRNDGKRWRCKNAAVPGSLFCDRHGKWSTSARKRKPRVARKKTNKSQGVVVGQVVAEEEQVEDKDVRDVNCPDDDGGGGDFYYRGSGLQPGSRKQARGGGSPRRAF